MLGIEHLKSEKGVVVAAAVAVIAGPPLVRKLNGVAQFPYSSSVWSLGLGVAGIMVLQSHPKVAAAWGGVCIAYAIAAAFPAVQSW